MKHLIPINELLKSTYLSAKRGLGDKHKNRGDEMLRHAAQSGEDVKQDRIYPYKFIFDGGNENEYYFIVNSTWDHDRKDNTSSRAMVLSVKIELRSNWGESKTIRLRFDDINPEHYRVDYSKLRYFDGEIFTNKDVKLSRKNALHLYRFFMQMWQDEIQEEFPEYEFQNFSVNSLYKSNIKSN